VDDLQDKVAVVTGGASGIGFGLATALLAEGCRVVVADVEETALEKATAELEGGARGRVHGVVTDVADLASVEALAASTLDRFGRVDVLCNNAGVSTFNTIEHLSIDDWKWVLGVDLWGVIHGVHVFLPIMVRQGTPAHIVSTASLAGLLSGTAQLVALRGREGRRGVVVGDAADRVGGGGPADRRERVVPRAHEHQRPRFRPQPTVGTRR
jgi:NAD(P)-dependent dehydrogenase (short-subunit alcohol dehydrogenase family)